MLRRGSATGNRRVRIYTITAAGRKQLQREMSSLNECLKGIARVMGRRRHEAHRKFVSTPKIKTRSHGGGGKSLEEKVDELVQSGMDRKEAVFEAKRRIVNRTSMLEQGHEVWSFSPVENLLGDLRFGMRSLAKSPLFTGMAALILALGIGANCAMFSLIDTVLLKPLPFPNAQRIVVVWEKPPHQDRHNPVSPVNYLDWRERTHSFDALAAVSSFPLNLSGVGEPRALDGAAVAADFFRVLGVSPLSGRTFNASEDVPNGPNLAVLSYGLWRGQFGGSTSIVGRTIRLHDRAYTVIGVMPKGFDLPYWHADIWVPAGMTRGMDKDTGRYLTVIGRLKPGASLQEARADIAGVAHRISQERPLFNRDWSATVTPLYEQTVDSIRTALLALFGAVTLVLLIAAANVANLLLMRGTQRRQEIAIRTALGANRTRIVFQLLVESFLLSAIAGAAGVALAFVGLHAIAAWLSSLDLPRASHLGLDAHVLTFSLALCFATTLVFGITPALTTSRADPNDALRHGGQRSVGQGSRKAGGLLVIFELALSLVLLAGAGLLVQSFVRLTTVERGFRIDHILTMRMFLSPGRYNDDSRRAKYIQNVLDRVRAVPGVEGASSAHFLPMTGNISGSCFTRADRPEPPPGLAPDSNFLIISPKYFSVMGTALLSGRDFDARDTFGHNPVIVVNEGFARQFFPNENPIGKRLKVCWDPPGSGVIVGVASNARQSGLADKPAPTIFLDQAQAPMYFVNLVVRTAVAPTAMAKSVERAIHDVDPNQPVYKVESMEDVVAESVARPRVESSLLALFAGLALVLSAVGLYGVLAYSVSQRTQEIGIRVALGAEPGQLVREVIRDALRLILPGIALGLIGSVAITRLLRSLLYETTPNDPFTFAAVSVVLIVVAMIAAYVPARRAARVDPITALRYE
jgi:putative ABC transport system permease protein